MKHLIIYLDTTQGLDKYVIGALHCSISYAQKQQKVSEKIDVSALFFAVALFFSQCSPFLQVGLPDKCVLSGDLCLGSHPYHYYCRY